MIKIPSKYKPLFDLYKAKTEKSNSDYWVALRGVDTVVVTGGRDSGKSFTTSMSFCDAAANYNHRILYTRYTLSSAQDSIIPDFNEKIGILGYDDFFHVTKDRILGKHNDSKIVFKGIKTSSGNQTATLKSLKDFSMFVVEEAEEFPTYDEWDKIQLSIRATDVQALNVLALNPASRKHWIYQEFFLKRGVKDGFNGIKGNVLYIHTTYLDLGKDYIAPKNWRKYEAARVVYERLESMSKIERDKQDRNDIKAWKYYKYTVLGGWKEGEEGLIYDDWSTFEEFPTDEDLRIFGLDFGFVNDPAAFVEVRLYDSYRKLYIKQHIYETGLLNSELAERIKTIIGEEECYIVADSAEPKSIAELQRLGLYVIKCIKGAGSVLARIRRVQDMEMFVHVDSTDIHDELNHYHTINTINSKGENVIHIVDKDNHACDAFGYAATLYG